MIQEKNVTSLDAEFLQDSANKEPSSQTLTVAQIVKNMMAKFGEQVLEGEEIAETDNSEQIQNAEESYTLREIKETRAKAIKYFEGGK